MRERLLFCIAGGCGWSVLPKVVPVDAPVESNSMEDAVEPGAKKARLAGTTSAELALRIVSLIAQRGELTVSEVARELEVSTSTAHRALSNCRRAGFVHQDNHGGPYVIGSALHEVALTVTGPRKLRDAADVVLAELQERVDEKVGFYTLEGRWTRIVQTGFSPRTAALSPALGKVLPAHCTAGGKALLSWDSPENLRKRFPGGYLTRYTDRTITDWAAFVEELEVSRRRGWAVGMGEYDAALTAVAVPVVLSTRVAVGAVVLTGESAWLHTRSEIEAATLLLVEAAHKVAQNLRG